MIPDYYAWFFSQRSTLTLYQQKEQAISMVKKHGMCSKWFTMMYIVFPSSGLLCGSRVVSSYCCREQQFITVGKYQ
mgnify:FL=1